MSVKRVVAGTGAALLFSVGVAAAFADTPTTPTTATDTTSTTSTTTETTTSSTTTTTTTVPEPTTSTTTTAPRPVPPPPPRERTRVAKRPLGVTADIPRKDEVQAPRRHKKRRHVSKPLKVTPPLGQGGYVFPVVGDAGYIDTYGDFRSDVHGKWHHGDDIFAALGTPVVAVATGTINRVGWRKAGGWRLWVRDSLANEFYYAHLSGYARSVFHSRYVKAGQVIGFVGNTGDAYPRAAHLHFEIHPSRLLGLNYDGAVDPTSYLDSWRHLQTADASQPVLPRLPSAPLVRSEARLVFRQLLAARRLLEPAPETPSFAVPSDAGDRALAAPHLMRSTAVAARPEDGAPALTIPLLSGGASLAMGAIAVLLGRLALRRFREEASGQQTS